MFYWLYDVNFKNIEFVNLLYVKRKNIEDNMCRIDLRGVFILNLFLVISRFWLIFGVDMGY